MSTDTPTPSPAPEPEPEAKKRKPKGIVSQEIHHEITVAEDCFRLTDEDEAILSALTARAWAGNALLGASVARCHQLVAEITGKRSTRSSRTAAELAARKSLLAALNPIIIAARDKYPKGSSERASYGLGEDLDAASTRILLDLTEYAFTQLGSAPPTDVLPGLLPAEIALLGTLRLAYKGADWAQTKAQLNAEDTLNALKIEVADTLTPQRHTCQNKADLAYPHTDKANRTTRKSFHLPPDKRAID